MAELPKETQEKLAQLQMLQQRLQLFVAQKQQFQLQLAEVDNALEELASAKGQAYKLIGEVLIEKDKRELKVELEEVKTKLDLRIKAIEKQEKSVREQALDLQKEVASKLKR